MSNAAITPKGFAPLLAVRRQQVARVVNRQDAPLCAIESDVQASGGRVTRLLASELLASPSLDGQTFRLLGRLYDGLIVPRACAFHPDEIALLAGIPVIFDDHGAAGLRE